MKKKQIFLLPISSFSFTINYVIMCGVKMFRMFKMFQQLYLFWFLKINQYLKIKINIVLNFKSNFISFAAGWIKWIKIILYKTTIYKNLYFFYAKYIMYSLSKTKTKTNTAATTFIYTATSSLVHENSMYEIGGKLDYLFITNITNSSWWDTICVMVVFAVVLSVLLITISFFLAVKKPDAEKLSPYECGFEPFGHSRQKFDIRYYLVSLLFILFDLEVVYLFPLIAVDEMVIKNGGFIISLIFLAILAIGIIYEFSKKALESV